MNDLPDLSIPDCRVRQQRLCEALTADSADRVFVTLPEHVQWLTGFRPHPLMRAAAVLQRDGECTLIAAGEPPLRHAADAVISYEAQRLCTLRQDQFAACVAKLSPLPGVTALEYSAAGPHLQQLIQGKTIDVEPTLWRLRRNKHPDELQMIGHAIRCTDAMYRRAREIIQPGITELDVFRELQSVAVATAGEPLTALGNDYQSNSPGGPPRLRAAQAGELMILDLGPAYRGYHADNCRTFAVDGDPTEDQTRARDVILEVFEIVRATVRPGTPCRDLFLQCKSHLDQYAFNAFFHHLGHGVGLYPHEAPHLNPHWQDTFEVGDVFTVEPGLYTEALNAGIRIEENYLVTDDGVQQLTSTPTDL